MKVKSYAAENDRMLFVIMPASSDPSALPAQVSTTTGKLTLFKEFDLVKEKPRIGVDTEKALADIASKGYHLSKVQILFEEEVVRKP